jgi:hypothetical protein
MRVRGVARWSALGASLGAFARGGGELGRQVSQRSREETLGLSRGGELEFAVSMDLI